MTFNDDIPSPPFTRHVQNIQVSSRKPTRTTPTKADELNVSPDDDRSFDGDESSSVNQPDYVSNKRKMESIITVLRLHTCPHVTRLHNVESDIPNRDKQHQ